MRAEELRIGNWIERLFEDESTGVEQCTVRTIWDIFKSETEESKFQFKPIPLTEDWLKRFGFESITESESGNYNYWNRDKDASVDVEPNITTVKIEVLFYYRVYEKMRRKSILYVHQLQNLYFALTGEELKLN